MEYLLFLQEIRLASASVLDGFFLKVTDLATPRVTFIFLAVIYWCFDKKIGQLMAMNVSIGCWFNQWIKQVFKVERPWVLDERIHPVESALAGAPGYSMPSGHTARAMAVYGSMVYPSKSAENADCLLCRLGRRLTGTNEPQLTQQPRKSEPVRQIRSIAAIITIALIMFSRNYLGVHTFADVFVTLILGIVFNTLSFYLLRWTEKEGSNRDIIFCAAACILIFLPMLRFGCLSNAGTSFGFLIGWLLEKRLVSFSTETSVENKIARLFFGILAVLLCYTSGTTVMTHIVPEKYAGFFLNVCAAFFIIFVYPFIFNLWEEKVSARRVIAGVLAAALLVCLIVGGAKVKTNMNNWGADESQEAAEVIAEEAAVEEITAEETAAEIVDTESADPVESAGSAGFAESAETAESAEPVESAGSADPVESADSTDESPYLSIPYFTAQNADILETPVKIIAHRGYSGISPENTIASFTRAIDVGADLIELDVQLTKDNRLVIFHDTDLARITGVGGMIADYTLDELRAMNFGAWFTSAGTGMSDAAAQENYGSETIPTLAEALELISQSDLDIYLELKDITMSTSLTEEQLNSFAGMVADEVEAYGMSDRVIYASFNYGYLQQIKEKNAANKTLCNTSIGDADILLSQYPADYYGLNIATMQQDTVEKIHNAGKIAYVYTVNTPAQMRSVINLGVDGIVTNYSGLAKVVAFDEYSYLSENYISSFAIPAMYDYNLTIERQNYIMQGLTKVGGYIVISAYDHSGTGNSILYILNTSGTLLKIVDLGFIAHTGGIAYDEAHDLLWLTAADAHIYAVSWSSIINGTYTGTAEEILCDYNTDLTKPNGSRAASFMTIDGDMIYFGTYVDGDNGVLRGNKIEDVLSSGGNYLAPEAEYVIPEHIQGVTFKHSADGVKTMILTQGHEMDDAALLSVTMTDGQTDYSEADSSVVLPEGAEQPVITANGLYILFESAARDYRAASRVPNDQVWLIEY